MTSRLLAASSAVVLGLAVLDAPGPLVAGDQELRAKALADNKQQLTAESSPKLRALVRPQEHEWRHLQVEWLTDVVATRKRAAAEDKPIIICYTGGAGYNEPLGVS